MLLRVRQCVAANAPSTHASKLRPSIAAARAVPVAARAVATRRSSHAAVAVSEHRLHPPFARYAHGTVVEDSQLVFTSGTLGIHKDGSIPESADDQARLALSNVLEILRAAAPAKVGTPLAALAPAAVFADSNLNKASTRKYRNAKTLARRSLRPRT